MKKKNFLFIIFISLCSLIPAQTKDSIRIINIDEIVVISTPKEHAMLRDLPVASTQLSKDKMQALQIHNLKDISAIAPNLFIPNYGSKLTSAIYIRGIGSRINTPSVGLYVDNVPYLNQSSFDFNYSDIERIDVLRGPQSTLYGRNTMGGLIKVHTKSPFSYQGTDFQIGAGTYNNYNTSVKHYHRTSNKFAFSTGIFYEHEGGFFKNKGRNDDRIDKLNEIGGRIRGIYIPKDNLKFDLSIGYEYSDQGGYPYGEYDKMTGVYKDPAYNEESQYRRGLLNAGLNVEYQAKHFILSAVTGYQNLNDRMFLDQDFTTDNIFTIEQKQKLNTLSEEIIFKSIEGKKWEWTSGVFGFYQWLNTKGPVTFYDQGVQTILEDNINRVFKNIPEMNMMNANIKFNERNLYVDGIFDTPVLSAAIFHQSTIHDLFIPGLSFTVGLRLDYEKNKIKYNSNSATSYLFSMTPPMPMIPPIELDQSINPELKGSLSDDYTQLLPKFALQYNFGKNNVYATVSKGYRSGGYNVQMFNGLVQTAMRNDMMGNVGEGTVKILEDLKASGQLPPPAIQGIDGIISKIKEFTIPEAFDIEKATKFKPEYSWNYEVGSHLTLFNDQLNMDLSAYLMDTRDQQLSKFEKSGLGRITENAGESRSYGVEVALGSQITRSFGLHASYGYTHATFRDYVTVDDKDQEVNYKGNRIPFVPTHTFAIGANYVHTLPSRCWLDRIQFDAQYNGAGRIYWTEQNDVSQSVYGLLNGKISFIKGRAQADIWVRNALNKDYSTFYFESAGTGTMKGFMQKGRPVHLGINLRCQF
ncbi:MAG: TonB-dependent receptor [Bacteroidales bacterium]|nr:TonB-dependent receptor [Bacteroidales bacterium]